MKCALHESQTPCLLSIDGPRPERSRTGRHRRHRISPAGSIKSHTFLSRRAGADHGWHHSALPTKPQKLPCNHSNISALTRLPAARLVARGRIVAHSRLGACRLADRHGDDRSLVFVRLRNHSSPSRRSHETTAPEQCHASPAVDHDRHRRIDSAAASRWCTADPLALDFISTHSFLPMDDRERALPRVLRVIHAPERHIARNGARNSFRIFPALHCGMNPRSMNRGHAAARFSY